MAKKQTRRSISVSKNTYERLKAYCETTNTSMSAFVEDRVGDFLGRSERQVRKPTDEEDKPAPRQTSEAIFTF